MKGIIRHDRDKLLRYFVSKKDFVMVRRDKRLICHGLLHESLIGYIWPAIGCQPELDFWDQILINNEDEKELWGRKGVTRLNDVNRALGATLGFEVIGSKGPDYVIPSLLK